MTMICSCCKKQELKLTIIRFKVGEELCNASALQCVRCTHIQEIMNIVSETFPIEGSGVSNTSDMRNLIDKSSGAQKETSSPQEPINQATLRALHDENIHISYDQQGNPSVTVADPKKPVMKNFFPKDIESTSNGTNPPTNTVSSHPEADQSPEQP